MIFSSFTYLVFLAIVLLLYYNVPDRFRIWLILIASYIFYMSWSPPFGLIYGPVIFLDSAYFYALSVAMVRWPAHKKSILIFGVTTELCLLGFFKYAGFISSSLDGLLAFFHAPQVDLYTHTFLPIANVFNSMALVPLNALGEMMHWPPYHVELQIFLPLAISFTNFILISYLVDVYRGDEKPDPSFLRFATYVAYFPHLIAGPIVRASELLRQFDRGPEVNLERFTQGIHKFLAGFAMKVFMADLVARYVNLVYGNPELHGFDTSWVATYAFAVQIFCDFAGYTLMAQGSALMMGYTLPDNFNAPYFAFNITDFWRRWHMSLSRWLKDYLYIPLGGSRQGRWMTYRNLFLTMGLGGLWHGASWNFVIWGLLHGMYLSLHKFSEFFKINRWIPTALAWMLTFHAVCIAWVFFRAQNFPDAFHMLSTMVNPATAHGLNSTGIMTLGLIGFFFIAHLLIRTVWKRVKNPWTIAWSQGLAYSVLIYLVITLRTPTQEFIYFQF